MYSLNPDTYRLHCAQLISTIISKCESGTYQIKFDRIEYGTAGFRSKGASPALHRAVFRCTLLAAIRSQLLNGQAIGMTNLSILSLIGC